MRLDPVRPPKAPIRTELQRAIAPLDRAQIARLELVPVEGDRLGGVSLKSVAVDPASGTRFVFKPTPAGDHRPELETWVAGMREAGGAPAVPAARQHLGSQQGYVKPMIANEGTLGWNPGRWTPGEQQAVVADAPWLDVLGNYDAKGDQYIRVKGSAVDIDWDLALSDYLHDRVVRDATGKIGRIERPPLDRYKNLTPLLPTSQNLLFADYVHGKAQLDLAPMRESARRIAGIPEAEMRRLFEPLGAALFAGGKTHGPYRNPDELFAAVLKRQRTAPARFERLIQVLDAERGRLNGTLSPRNVISRVGASARDLVQTGAAFWVASPGYEKATHLIQDLGKRLGIENPNTLLGA